MVITRFLQQKIENCFFQKKVIILYGARQVGKTTLIRQLAEKYAPDTLFLNGDESDIRETLTHPTSTGLKALFGQKKIIFIDEAQRIRDIGLTLKLAVDNFPELQIIATGSSSFELSNTILEPLTGRALEFWLYPFSLGELAAQQSPLELKRLLERQLRYGLYPEIISGSLDPEQLLPNIARSYAYKDILQFEAIRHPEVIEKLLTALALQVGQEVSYNELANLLGVNRVTIANYIRILEQAFIIFRLPPLHRNARKELGKLRKIYFFDVGIRNALINNFNTLSQRGDVGALWENFWVAERLKYQHYQMRHPSFYFWRTLTQQEVDLAEEEGGKLQGFECKWSASQRLVQPPSMWNELYPEATFNVITPDTYLQFLGIE